MPHYGDSHYRHEEKLDARNIYHVKTTVSDLKDEDFAIAALEYKIKKMEQELATTKQQKKKKKRERERERLKTTRSLFSLC